MIIKEIPAKWFIVASRLRGQLEKAISLLEEDTQEINKLKEENKKLRDKLIYLGFRDHC